MPSSRTYRVKEVASLAGVSVRALHHYHNVGLLVPSARSPAGYRLYTDEDVLRLQQIVVQRALGFSLRAIKAWLDDPAYDRKRALVDQRNALMQRADEARAMMRSIDRALALLERPKEETMRTDMQTLFDGFDPKRHEGEAQKRWGDTEACAAATRRTAGYGEAEWHALKEEQAAIYADAMQALQDGVAPDAPGAMAIAERHRRSMDRWFYPCSLSMHAALADLYEHDPRFAAQIDRHGEGLTPYLARAMRANAQRAQGSIPGTSSA